MPNVPKVREDEFKAALRALLSTPPTPAAKIVTRNTKKSAPKKRG
jgi:hypothetical protein